MENKPSTQIELSEQQVEQIKEILIHKVQEVGGRQEEVKDLLLRNLDAFKPKRVDLSKVSNVKIHIAADAKPIAKKPKTFNKEDTKFLNEETERLEKMGVIRRS